VGIIGRKGPEGGVRTPPWTPAGRTSSPGSASGKGTVLIRLGTAIRLGKAIEPHHAVFSSSCPPLRNRTLLPGRPADRVAAAGGKDWARAETETDAQP